MKMLMIKCTFLGVSLFSASLAFAAMKSEKVPTLGGYCSATTSDGVWSYRFGFENQYYQCDEVRGELYNTTAAPIVGLRQGTYLLQDLNTVKVQCHSFVKSITGKGGEPLARAYQLAVASADYSCLITVE